MDFTLQKFLNNFEKKDLVGNDLRKENKKYLEYYKKGIINDADLECNLNIPYILCQDMANFVTTNLKIKTTSENEEFLKNFNNLNKISKLKVELQRNLATIGQFFRFFKENKKVGYQVIHLENVAVLNIDNFGEITEIAFKINNKIEHHLIINESYTIRIYNFNNDDDFILENEINENLNYEVPLFLYFKNPLDNQFNLSNNFSQPVFARALTIIELLNKKIFQIEKEFKDTETAIIAPKEFFGQQKNKDNINNSVLSLPTGHKRNFFTKENIISYESTDTRENNITIFNPTIRINEHERYYNLLLKLLELATGIGEGIYSSSTQGQKTATEIRVGETRTRQTIDDLQKAFEDNYRKLFKVVYYLSTFDIVKDEDLEVAFDFEEPFRDFNLRLSQMVQLLQLDVLSREEVRQFYFNENEEEALEKIQEIINEGINNA